MVLESQQQFVKTVNMRMIGGGNVKKGIVNSGNNMLFRVSRNRQAGLGTSTLTTQQLKTLYGRGRAPTLTLYKVPSGSPVTHETMKSIVGNSPHSHGNMSELSTTNVKQKAHSAYKNLVSQKSVLDSLLDSVADDVLHILFGYSDDPILQGLFGSTTTSSNMQYSAFTYYGDSYVGSDSVDGNGFGNPVQDAIVNNPDDVYLSSEEIPYYTDKTFVSTIAL
tara:strand:+ start:2737 stop:3399 length:663 start_codon:yes stop_codon:yes gene_type:complete